ncbi:MAG TPA: hypothetical protein VGB33_00550 [Acidimicrobiia bacterium]|jgi:hypothetical protein
MQATRVDVSPEVRRFGRRAGYIVAVIINVLMLIVVQNILDWDVLPFLTDRFEQVVPWVTLSLTAVIVANLIYLFKDAQAIRSTGGIVTNLISLIVTYQVYQVFPFDFSAYDFNWGVVTRVVLIVAMVGAGIGMLTESIRLASGEPDTQRR